MHVVTRTPTMLVVTHRESPERIRNVLLCAAFILLAPLVLSVARPSIGGLPAVVMLVLVVAFAGCAVVAYWLSGYEETYSLDTSGGTFEIRSTTRRGTTTKRIQLSDVIEMFHESWDDNDAIKEYVVLSLAPTGKRLKLPVRLYSFSAREREQFAHLLGELLGSPLRLAQRAS